MTKCSSRQMKLQFHVVALLQSEEAREGQGEGKKTYNTRDSPVVTDSTTSLVISELMYRNKGVLREQLGI